MSNENWTEGEWRINQRPHGKVSIVGRDGHQVCLMWNCKFRDGSAHLIAAAPELHEALKKVVEWFDAEDDHSKTTFHERVGMANAAEKAAKAALAKARGGL